MDNRKVQIKTRDKQIRLGFFCVLPRKTCMLCATFCIIVSVLTDQSVVVVVLMWSNKWVCVCAGWGQWEQMPEITSGTEFSNSELLKKARKCRNSMQSLNAPWLLKKSELHVWTNIGMDVLVTKFGVGGGGQTLTPWLLVWAPCQWWWAMHPLPKCPVKRFSHLPNRHFTHIWWVSI